MDDDEVEMAFEWTALHELHSYAWRAASGRLPHVGVTLGLCLIDALKTGSLDDQQAEAYADILREVDITGERPKWD